MATMVKEKRREKKRNEEKSSRSSLPEEPASSLSQVPNEELLSKTQEINETQSYEEVNISEDLSNSTSQISENETPILNIHAGECVSLLDQGIEASDTIPISAHTDIPQQKFVEIDSFTQLNARLERIIIPEQNSGISTTRMLELENERAYLQSSQNQQESHKIQKIDSAIPSAPAFEKNKLQVLVQVSEYVKPKVECLPLDEAIKMFCGKEMAAVKDMSDREVAEVEAGPSTGPEHPLVDLLSTFRSSLKAMERECTKLASNFDEEKKYRSTLWMIEKRTLYLKEPCNCGVYVDLTATFQHAQLLKERLPVAKMKLEGLLRDVQESYCQYQHASLLAHCQIEDLISETIKSNKKEIRDALSLILQALSVSDGAPEALPAALQRWAEILTRALVDARDLRQLLFVLHHLFRQTRSVSWAGRWLTTRVTDSVSAAQALGVLNTMLTKLQLEPAVECNEETEEGWEEVDLKGGSGAVRSGTLRERDLIGLVRALPLQQLIAKLVLFTNADFRNATEYEWGDTTGGHNLIKSCCAVRALISVLQRGVTLHAAYARLHRVCRGLANAALTALASLYHTARAPYAEDLKEKITAELKAAFSAGFTLFGTQDLHNVPTTLLSEEAAKDYCFNFMVGLHEQSPKLIETLSLEAPVLPCGQRLRIVTQAAVDRVYDHELARIVMDFILQIGLKRKSVPCKAGCEPIARECIPQLLTAHPYLRQVALYTVADLSQVETLDGATVSVLQVHKWRPDVNEMHSVLADWSRRCPAMLQQLLLQLDYTPHTGVSLPVQLHIGSWLCSEAATSPAACSNAWRVLLHLRTHLACWQGAMGEAPPSSPLDDVFTMAYAVLSADWGHSIPLICSRGVNALITMCATRPREAVHCLAPVMLVMSHSPESVSLTPKFAELFTLLVNCGPNVMQRALGRGGVCGSELLLRLVLSQVEMKGENMFTVWLHALWQVPAAMNILDIAAMASRDWFALDNYAASLLNGENAKDHLDTAVRLASTSPLLCECLLRARHAQEMNTHLFPALVTTISKQRAASQKIHVDNALQKIKAPVSSEQLVIYRCANAALVAPLTHPSHLTLWRLFFHMYLQRPPDQNTLPPAGPLFFSGLIKSRTLSQIKKRLQETAAYHLAEFNSLKDKHKEPTPEAVRGSRSNAENNSLFPPLTLADLTGEDNCGFESDSSDSDGDASVDAPVDDFTMNIEALEHLALMAHYHVAAESMIKEYLQWLEQGEKVQAFPNRAIERFIRDESLEEAWQLTVAVNRPSPSAELDRFPRPVAPPPYNTEVPTTPLATAVASIERVKCRSIRYRRLTRLSTESVDAVDVTSTSTLLSAVDKLLKSIEKHAHAWDAEVTRISSLDSRLWKLVSTLRVPRPLPPVKRRCSKNCHKPVTFHLNTNEWCISEGTKRAIGENRLSSLAGIRRLTRTNPEVARTAASLHTIARRIRTAAQATQVAMLAWKRAANVAPCPVAQAAHTALFDLLAERWITNNGELCGKLLAKTCAGNTSALQQALCGALVAPRRMAHGDWPSVYVTLLNATLPAHTIFSYLSRFEMARWSETAHASQRHSVVEALVRAAQRFGPQPDSVLIEIIGVHTALLINAQELSWILLSAARSSVQGSLPIVYWKHLNRAAEARATEISLEELTALLRDLGRVWSKFDASYAPSFAYLVCVLVRAAVQLAMRLSYEPVRVAWTVWEAMAHAWGSLLTRLVDGTGDEHNKDIMKRFTLCIQQFMEDCPGSEIRLLQEIFSWVISTYESQQGRPAMRPRTWVTSLLCYVAQLPWTKFQWFHAPCVHTLCKVIHEADEELKRWCCDRIASTNTETLLVGLESSANVGHHLARLLYLFTGNIYLHDPQLLNEGAMLPWWHLSEEDLMTGLGAFFQTHYNPANAYHDLPQAIVILNAGELQPRHFYSPNVRRKRAHLVTQWTLRASEPALITHRPAFTRHCLHNLTDMDPYLLHPEESEDLLQRVGVLTRWEPTENSTVLPVWQHWITNTATPRMLSACIGMASTMETIRFAASIADEAIRMHLHNCEGGWAEIHARWSRPSERARHSPRQLAAAGALHAAYGGSHAHTRVSHAWPPIAALNALTDTNCINFIKDEAIVAVWICYLARVIRECDIAMASGTHDVNEPSASEIEECKHAAVSLLKSWGQQPRRSLLKVVTMQVDTDRTTARHRALIRLADCILTPSPAAFTAFESACAAVGSLGDVTAWGRAQTARNLPRMAMRIYANVPERYFLWELDHAPAD